VGDRHDAAAIRLTLRPQGLLAPLDQPTSTPVGPGRRALVLPGFHAQGSPPGRAGYDYLGNRKTPRAGLSPAGSMLLWAALERRWSEVCVRALEASAEGSRGARAGARYRYARRPAHTVERPDWGPHGRGPAGATRAARLRPSVGRPAGLRRDMSIAPGVVRRQRRVATVVQHGRSSGRQSPGRRQIHASR